jgi:excisionase family DNA binding protein
MADYLSLDEAAEKLGISHDKLVELRSQGQVRGFRDGASWKFPANEIERLQDDLGDLLGGGSGILVGDDSELSLGSSIIGGDEGPEAEEGSGSDLGIGSEPLSKGSGGSDVNLVSTGGNGSDVAIVASDMDLLGESAGDLLEGDDLLEIDSAELSLDDPAIMHDSAQIDLAIEPNSGSTGPVTDAELKEIAESHPDILAPEEPASKSVSDLDMTLEKPKAAGGSADSHGSLLDMPSGDLGLSAAGNLVAGSDEDSGEVVLGAEDDSGLSVLGDEVAEGSAAGASSLELLRNLDTDAADNDPLKGASRGIDVLSELDLLSAEQGGSGLISGDSEDLLVSSGVAGGSGLGSSMGADMLGDSDLSDIDDALADDDDLVIADDDDDLVISSAGSDISVAGDSGINLMSPSDSGLSLESEPLDLAGSSISALDLGAELSEGSGSGSGSGKGSGALVDFQADEEFQLSPSGVGLDADIDSGSQVIEIEDSSEAVGEAVDFDDAAVAEADPLGGDVFGDSAGFAEGGFDGAAGDDGFGADDGEAIALDDSDVRPLGVGAAAAYEVPFSMLQCVALMSILLMMGIGGMLMTDLVRNMWTYNDISAPVSTLTDSLIGLIE